MKGSSKVLNFFTILLLAIFASCVGTVQDTKVDINSLSEEDKEVISFPGLEKAQAISHDKIELEFTPNGNTDPNIKYYLYINGSQSPIEVNPTSLDDALAGRKRYLVTGLEINRPYKFRLRLKNLLTGAESRNEKELVAQTFDNKTADFRGVTSLTKVTGLSATSIKVEWVPAKMDGVIISKEFDPVYYEVTIIGPGGAQNLNNPNYTALDRRIIKVPDPLSNQITPSNHSQWLSTIIDSLQPSTNYYVQVRAVNKLWYGFSIDPLVNNIPVNREVNTKFLKIKTDPATGLFDFNVDSLKLVNAPADDSFTKVNVFWQPGTGTFTGYRIFLRKYPNAAANEGTVLGDDRISLEQMKGISDGTIPPSDDNGRFLPAATTISTLQVGGLITYQWYQFKIVQCKTLDCPVELTDPDAGIVSDLRAIRVQPTLAPFDGITRIDNPKDPSGLDEIKVNFDPPAMTVGFADTLEVYCLDPDSIGTDPQAYIFDTNPLTTTARAGSPVSRCNGLKLTADPTLADKSVIIKGVKAIPSNPAATSTYCFAIFPAIRYQAEQIPAAGTYPVQDWVVRCTTPEIKTPTVSQFPGLTGNCNPVQNTIAVSWTAPTGGIYANYRLFYRAISGPLTFKFSDAVSGVAGYNSVSIPDGTTSYTLTDLRPGTRYRVGVLTQIVDGAQTLYSEFNTTIKDCMTPMPVATFDEWTRVFAIGPKVDGRFPHTTGGGGTRIVPDKAKILESLDVDGVPYEVGTDSAGNIDNATYLKPPGHYHATYDPTNFVSDFDGAFGSYQAVSVGASRNGIVSLAWKDMTLDFLQTEFRECQRHPTDPALSPNVPTTCNTIPAQRKNRLYGYKVFRSDDNRLSWKDVTGADGASGVTLVYARDFKYYKRPNVAASTERMAFFTDYSVQAIYSDPEGRERGRILWYKIVPYFEKRALSVSGSGVSSPNIIKVILPPPNMALVKREMANRNACMEIGRDDSMDKTYTGHYSCAFNGVGARPKGTPWNINAQIIDLGGDLLVDRYELGCQYTRGDFASIPEYGLSFFEDPTADNMGSRSDLVNFAGFRTEADGTPTSDKFLGCASGSNQQIELESTSSHNSDVDMTPNYKKVLWGDCLGHGSATMATAPCADDNKVSKYTYKYPGGYQPLTPYDCTVRDADRPTTLSERFSVEFRRNLLVQSEYGAVFYHRDARTGMDMIYPTGPGHQNLIINSTWYSKQKQCFINLAAVGSDNKIRARWFPAEDFGKVKSGAGIQSITNKTIGQLYTDPNLYDTGEYKLPNTTLRSTQRFDENTTMAKIVSANSSKLPPLTGISQPLAQEFCSAYDIEVGVSTDGTNFLATYLPTTKRLLRKTEILAASHWPSSGNNHAQSYDYTDTRIAQIEGGNGAGSCINSSKYTSSSGLSRGWDLRPDTATWNPTGVNYSGRAITGTAKADDPLGTDHSGDCTSEFGIQDMVGNSSELTTERMFCDYSKDKLWYGVYDGDPYAQTGVGDQSRSVQIPDDQSNDRLFWQHATIHFEQTDGSYKQVGTRAVDPTPGDPANMDSSPEITETVAWPQPDPTSGYCSIVDNVEARSYPANYLAFRDLMDNFYPVSNPGGALNSNMILIENTIDRESVNYLRNGDGFFLNFGANNLAPQFKDGNSLSITDNGITLSTPEEEALGPFFNPWVGFPMACKNDSCLLTDDNTRITTPYLNTKAGTATPAITDYPIGNSQIFNIGISDVLHRGNSAFVTMDLTTDPYNYSSPVITDIYVGIGGNIQTMTTQTLSDWWTANPAERTVQKFSGIRFALPRNTPLIYTNGGSFNNTKTGRYTMSVISGTEESTKLTVGPGIRCGIMIDSD